MAYWEEKLKELGGVVTIAGLDLTHTNSRDWSNRFLISVDPVIERSALCCTAPNSRDCSICPSSQGWIGR